MERTELLAGRSYAIEGEPHPLVCLDERYCLFAPAASPHLAVCILPEDVLHELPGDDAHGMSSRSP